MLYIYTQNKSLKSTRDLLLSFAVKRNTSAWETIDNVALLW